MFPTLCTVSLVHGMPRLVRGPVGFARRAVCPPFSPVGLMRGTVCPPSGLMGLMLGMVCPPFGPMGFMRGTLGLALHVMRSTPTAIVRGQHDTGAAQSERDGSKQPGNGFQLHVVFLR